ncbi:MAG: hypothetical protein B6I17_03920 [Tenericutes bacterium 4572_104]|nr:MAG: hypothetical protein B6I17_03920 [Tenericutes bacterium 4572_104]
MKITIRDVADKAGVSPATVSLVLNNKSGVGETTREKVFKIAESLGYDTLKEKKQSNTGGTIRFLKIVKHGHVLNRDHNIFISDYIDGIEKEAKKYEFRLEIKNYNGFNLKHIVQDLKDSSIGGLIVLGTELNYDDITLFHNIRVPIVFVDASHPYSPFDFIDMDNEGAVFSLVSALKKQGHKKIGLVKAIFETRNFRLREKSFYDALSFFGLESNKSWEYVVDSTFEQSYLDMKEQLKEERKLPTAFFCVCDIISFGCMKALKGKGLRIPEDISIVGFDDLPSCLLSDPPLSSVKVSKTRIGRRAFQLLNRRLQASEKLPYEKIFIGRELIIRESIGENKL